jgi:hypothetical protein
MTRSVRGLAGSENGSIGQTLDGEHVAPPCIVADRAKAGQQELERARPVVLGAEQQPHQMSDFAVHSVSGLSRGRISTYRTVFRPNLPCRDVYMQDSAAARPLR